MQGFLLEVYSLFVRHTVNTSQIVSAFDYIRNKRRGIGKGKTIFCYFGLTVLLQFLGKDCGRGWHKILEKLKPQLFRFSSFE